MEKINRQRSPKGLITVRKKGNSYEARVTLELISVMKGVNKNPRLSRTAKTEEQARLRLEELITDIYFDMKNKMHSSKVFSNDCASELDNFEEFKKIQKQKNTINAKDKPIKRYFLVKKQKKKRVLKLA